MQIMYAFVFYTITYKKAANTRQNFLPRFFLLPFSYSNASLCSKTKKMKHDSHNRIMTFTKIFNKTKNVLTFFHHPAAKRAFKSYIKSFLALTVFHFYYIYPWDLCCDFLCLWNLKTKYYYCLPDLIWLQLRPAQNSDIEEYTCEIRNLKQKRYGSSEQDR